jgi:predicted O-methyltransferase YrrM
VWWQQQRKLSPGLLMMRDVEDLKTYAGSGKFPYDVVFVDDAKKRKPKYHRRCPEFYGGILRLSQVAKSPPSSLL